MANFDRREFLAAFFGTSKVVEAGDPSFMNNVPDPLLAEKDLPTFKFALEKSKGKVSGQSYAKEATVTQLPISKGIAGVTMVLAPGVMRELHWHATAAEWAYVNKGRVRTTVTAPGWPVGSVRPNALGVFDMYGNVREWCQDGLQPNAKSASSEIETIKSDSNRVLPGGAFNDRPDGLRALHPGDAKPSEHGYNFGFRPARTLP